MPSRGNFLIIELLFMWHWKHAWAVMSLVFLSNRLFSGSLTHRAICGCSPIKQFLPFRLVVANNMCTDIPVPIDVVICQTVKSNRHIYTKVFIGFYQPIFQ